VNTSVSPQKSSDPTSNDHDRTRLQATQKKERSLSKRGSEGESISNGLSSMLNKLTFGIFGPSAERAVDLGRRAGEERDEEI